MACPHCLTEIAPQENPLTQETTSSPDKEMPKIKLEPAPTAEEKTAQEPTKARCAHYLGYLSQRSSKERIPEECITCPDTINCILKTLKNQTES
jgi:hypothetical protein